MLYSTNIKADITLEGNTIMYKGIFWYYVTYFDDDMYSYNLLPVYVKCDINGNSLEECKFSSKSGNNFNHKIEWDKMHSQDKIRQRHPYNYSPRGRVEIRNGIIKVYANPVILDDEKAINHIIELFELVDYKESIRWISDNSKHYQYCIDAMGSNPACFDD